MIKLVLFILFFTSSYSFSGKLTRPPLPTKGDYASLGLAAFGLGAISLFCSDMSLDDLWGTVLKKVYKRKLEREERKLQSSLRGKDLAQALANALNRGSH